jgi:hypothetical protein
MNIYLRNWVETQTYIPGKFNIIYMEVSAGPTEIHVESRRM